MKPGRRKCPKTYRKYKGYCFKYITTNANTSTKQRLNIVINQTRKNLIQVRKVEKIFSWVYISSKPGYCEKIIIFKFKLNKLNLKKGCFFI